MTVKQFRMICVYIMCIVYNYILGQFDRDVFPWRAVICDLCIGRSLSILIAYVLWYMLHESIVAKLEKCL